MNYFWKKLSVGVMLAVLAVLGVLAVLTTAPGARAQDVVAMWGKIVAPPAPALHAVTLDAAHTAFLVLDFSGTQNDARGPCNSTKPRCKASIPAVAAMLATARAAHVLVVYSITVTGTPADIDPALAPQPGDAVVQAGPDKFVGTKLADILAAHKIKTIVAAGTAAEGAVLQTVTDAVLRDKLSAVVPVDGISSVLPYEEQYVAWQLTAAPGLAGKVVLTRGGMISYK